MDLIANNVTFEGLAFIDASPSVISHKQYVVANPHQQLRGHSDKVLVYLFPPEVIFGDREFADL